MALVVFMPALASAALGQGAVGLFEAGKGLNQSVGGPDSLILIRCHLMDAKIPSDCCPLPGETE